MPIFDPLRKQVYYISLCSSISIWLPPSPSPAYVVYGWPLIEVYPHRIYEEPSKECEPYRYTVENGETKPIVPCGAIANSLFNDTIEIDYIKSDSEGACKKQIKTTISKIQKYQ